MEEIVAKINTSTVYELLGCGGSSLCVSLQALKSVMRPVEARSLNTSHSLVDG